MNTLRPLIHNLASKAVRLYESRLLIIAIIVFGAFLRLNRYLFNRSLRGDEAALAVNILDRSPAELLQPLKYDQAAPIGFMVATKRFTQAFGLSEPVLRFIPLAAGLLALVLFYLLAKKFLPRLVLPVAILLFAMSDPLITFSVEVKPYSLDVLIALILLLLVLNFDLLRSAWRGIALVGIIGAISIWFSHPAIFVLVGIVAATGVRAVQESRGKSLLRPSLAFSVWALSFLILYLLSLRETSQSEELINYWSEAFMPFPPTSLSDWEWIPKSLYVALERPVGLDLRGGAALLFLVGLISFLAFRPKEPLLLVLPIIAVMGASALQLYPFSERLILFTVPMFLIVVVKGLDDLVRLGGRYKHLLLAGSLFLVAYFPVKDGVARGLNPRMLEEMRPVISYLDENYQDGDRIYLYYSSEWAFEYYRQYLELDHLDYITGEIARSETNRYFDQIDELAGNPRVWIVFSHVFRGRFGSEQRLIVKYARCIGDELDNYLARGASVYLYDLGVDIDSTIGANCRES